jgi:hypothetical protein
MDWRNADEATVSVTALCAAQWLYSMMSARPDCEQCLLITYAVHNGSAAILMHTHKRTAVQADEIDCAVRRSTYYVTL